MDQRSAPFSVWHDEAADIVQVDWAAAAVVDRAAAEASTEAVRALGRDGVLMLVDTRGIRSFERDARAHFLADQADSLAMALLVGSAVNKMIANFFMGMHRQAIPVRMFTEREPAIAWLHEQR
jgi:hypothetical protein